MWNLTNTFDAIRSMKNWAIKIHKSETQAFICCNWNQYIIEVPSLRTDDRSPVAHVPIWLSTGARVPRALLAPCQRLIATHGHSVSLQTCASSFLFHLTIMKNLHFKDFFWVSSGLFSSSELFSCSCVFFFFVCCFGMTVVAQRRFVHSR